MDWRSIKNNPPAPGTGIRATDGKSVFVGHIMQNVPWFTGVSMDDGSDITIGADNLTEWMPLENQPENFTQKVKRIISEIRDMIGEKMYYGEMVGAPGPYCNCGPMVYEDPEDYNLEKAADILQGALDGNFLGEPDLMPEKTADEMFRELGYTVNRMNAKIMSCDRSNEHIVINAGETGICAAKFVDTYKAGEEAYWPGMTLSDTMPTQHTVPLNRAERIALARLIEEMEESK